MRLRIASESREHIIISDYSQSQVKRRENSVTAAGPLALKLLDFLKRWPVGIAQQQMDEIFFIHILFLESDVSDCTCLLSEHMNLKHIQ